MGRTGKPKSTKGGGKARQQPNETRPPKKRKTLQQGGTVDRESGNNEDDRSDGDDSGLDEAEKELEAGDIRGDLTNCRKGLEQLFVKFTELEAKVEIMDKRLVELQLDRSEATGGIDGLNRKKRIGCYNEKDSLFKEAYETASGKLKVWLITISST